MAGNGDERRGAGPYNPLMPFNAFIYDLSLVLSEKRGMAARRGELLASARGRVLELGAGTGLNLRHYPDGVDLVVSEPDPGMRARLERRAAGRATVIDAGAEELPFPDASFDTVVSTLVLCTVADPAAALAEVRRVLAPDGRLLLIEHVRASEPRLERRQDRLAGLWHACAMGCRCNQPTVDLLEGAGLSVEQLTPSRWRAMPAIVGPLVVGAAS